MLDFRLLPLEQDGATRQFKQEVDLSYIKQWGGHPFQKPVQVTGTLTELDHGLFNLQYQVNYTSVLPCGRCLTNVELALSLDFIHQLGKGAQSFLTQELDEDLKRGRLHLTGVVATDLLDSLDQQALCADDCQGLCSQCGKDNNSGVCACKQEKVHDPRFDVLRELLGK